MQFNFVLGVSGCTPATVGNLDYLVQAAPRRLHLDRHRHRPQRLAHGRRRHRHGRQRPGGL